MSLTIGSLFSGIGGLELGLERAGLGPVLFQVEKDPYCRRVLARHWPDAIRYEDVTTVDWSTVEPVEVLCGGFPCQDISFAGAGAGIDGDRSGLWLHFVDAIRVVRPRYVVMENVAALRQRGLGRVLRDLSCCGYDAEWDCIRASDVGAPHERTRIFVVAYPQSISGRAGLRTGEPSRLGRRRPCDGGSSHHVWPAGPNVRRGSNGLPVGMDGDSGQHVLTGFGVPHRSARLHALGNAVVPQVAEVVGRRLVEITERGRQG